MTSNLKIGDIVFFKSDVEQFGRVVSIKMGIVTVVPYPDNRFEGDYIKNYDEYRDHISSFAHANEQ